MKTPASGHLLTIDTGNTNTVLGVHNPDGRVIHAWRFASDLRRTEDEYVVLLRQLEQDDASPPVDFKGACLCSVVPPLTPVLRRAVQRVHGVEPLVLESSTRLNVRNRYGHPEEVGADRLANAAGGRDRYGVPLIIVDFGTATTLDVVSARGDYLGGCILPGIETSAEALFRRTAKLPRISPERPPEPLGRTTIESIQSGLFYGAVDAVDGLIERLRATMGEDAPVIATGGLAQTFVGFSKYIREADPHLTLHGLWVIWHLNAPRRGRAKTHRRS